jgi:hypothetical protein
VELKLIILYQIFSALYGHIQRCIQEDRNCEVLILAKISLSYFILDFHCQKQAHCFMEYEVLLTTTLVMVTVGPFESVVPMYQTT